MEAHAEAQANTRLLKIDVDHWESPVAQQFGISRLPHVLVYDGTELVATGREQMQRVLSL